MTARAAKQKGVPTGYKVYPVGADGIPWEEEMLLREEPVLHGGEMASAQPGFDLNTNSPIVTFRFNPAGTHTFATFTRNNIGRPFAIVIDGRVVTAPMIVEPILRGVGQISGNLTSASAAQLAARIRSGTCAEVSRLLGPRLAGAV